MVQEVGVVGARIGQPRHVGRKLGVVSPQPVDLHPERFVRGHCLFELLAKRDVGHTKILSPASRAVVDSHAIPRDENGTGAPTKPRHRLQH
jgi:hypothetical protein